MSIIHTSYSGRLVSDINGVCFKIEENLWQRNRQQWQLLLRYLALPLREDESNLWLGVDSFNNISACETFSFLTGKLVEPVELESEVLKGLLRELSPSKAQAEENPLLYSADNGQLSALPKEIVNASDEPMVQLLEEIFENARKKKASDIHLEPKSDRFQIRYRIDGVLQVWKLLAPSLASRLISRLKLLARLDIGENRLPQDGRFYFKTKFSDLLDFRLSTLPTSSGEKVVLRLQQNKPVELSFTELGMEPWQQAHLERILKAPQGLILVTGPTGSGKSISLYTALQYLNQPEKHIMTAEDPIEIELEGIVQTQVNRQIGLDFSRLLRTFLRQDPDIIMLGEIRDEESAAIALRAAQTGHLVLSTLHTNDAQSAISRLLQLGVQQHEIDSCLLLVIAQRLVRKCCPLCKVGKEAVEDNNCGCFQGYKGRTGIYQFLWPRIAGDKITYQTDFPSLFAAAKKKVESQITDSAEISRVLGEE
ncbi:protein transport protein HofB [Mesocricetibacter intestinalis]|uniref:Protein transport protein HofB n=1 Tax=Mesocricetibacter intestinalis TaxID=1521930 RepID=A0A4R6VCX0_9PAST|nr:GspE/PulE family protein [Mesocricetibacter intestinalis]TDQ58143.1 protein transport protein HofB [Mesocricetibacter intestinalis]